MNKKMRKIMGISLVAAMAGSVVASETVSISVQDTEMRSVLKFISEQSGTSIVISPDVSTKQLDINLKNVDLEEALDVILKPYGCGYRKVGETIVVDQLENLDRLTAVEPLVSDVVTLKFLDAKGVVEIVESMLTERGSVKMLKNEQKLGWDFASSGSDEGAGKLDRATDSEDENASSKTLVISDTPSNLTRIQDIINDIDVKPKQIEIKSYFVEFSNGAEKDIGVQWSLAKNDGEYTTGNLLPDGTTQNGTTIGTDLGAAASGMLFGVVRNGGEYNVAAQLAAMQENEDVNVLSAPRIVTQENQEASILVGEKYPIISSDSDGESGTVTIELDYFERIGIQLNVIPQICDDSRISMVIHPAVTSLDSLVQASISTPGTDKPINYDTPFPIITTREAETRLTVQDGATVAIGGLVSERETVGEKKVPLLGDIPLVGRLFRRDITGNEKVELVILMNATVLDESEASVVTELNDRVQNSETKLLSQWGSNDAPVATTVAE